VALLTLALYALIFAFIKVDVKKISSQFRKSTPVKLISGYMLFFAVFLGSLWIIRAVNFIITGQVPQDIIKTGHPTAVVYATDLSLLIPALVMSAILLWRREPWGYVLSAVVMIKSVTYSLVLIIMSIVGYLRMGEGDSMISLWIFLSVTCLFALGFLLGNMNSLNILKEEK
jgi:hypothetical protein